MDQFDWNLLKSFIGVLDHGSLSAASRALGISQPTLGRHVDQLESALGVTLFTRGRDGLTPTTAALAVADPARKVAEAAAAAAFAAAGRASEISGTIRITASQIVATYLLPPVIARLLERMPGLEVEIGSSNAIENLLHRDADIAIRMVRPAQLDLVARKIAEIGVGAYAHRDYLARVGKAPASIQDLSDHVIIGYDRSDLVIRGFRRAGVQVDRHFFRFRCDDQVAAEALAHGVGIGFAPNYLARRVPGLMALEPLFRPDPMPMWLVTHRELHTSARIRAVFDYLGDSLSALDLS